MRSNDEWCLEVAVRDVRGQKRDWHVSLSYTDYVFSHSYSQRQLLRCLIIKKRVS